MVKPKMLFWILLLLDLMLGWIRGRLFYNLGYLNDRVRFNKIRLDDGVQSLLRVLQETVGQSVLQAVFHGLFILLNGLLILGIIYCLQCSFQSRKYFVFTYLAYFISVFGLHRLSIELGWSYSLQHKFQYIFVLGQTIVPLFIFLMVYMVLKDGLPQIKSDFTKSFR